MPGDGMWKSKAFLCAIWMTSLPARQQRNAARIWNPYHVCNRSGSIGFEITRNDNILLAHRSPRRRWSRFERSQRSALQFAGEVQYRRGGHDREGQAGLGGLLEWRDASLALRHVLDRQGLRGGVHR